VARAGSGADTVLRWGITAAGGHAGIRAAGMSFDRGRSGSCLGLPTDPRRAGRKGPAPAQKRKWLAYNDAIVSES